MQDVETMMVKESLAAAWRIADNVSNGAVNPSGVALAIYELVGHLRAAGVADTDALNAHPAVRVAVHHLATMARVADCKDVDTNVSNAYADLARAKKQGVF